VKLYKYENGLYCIDNGLRRKFIDMNDFHSWGLKVEDIQEVSEGEVLRFPIGGSVPNQWTLRDWLAPPVLNNKRKIREICVSQIEGVGVEFGAGSHPLPVPLGIQLDYMDPFDMSIQKGRMFQTSEAKDFVVSKCDSIEEMLLIDDESLDFILAAHVIEHTKNPLNILALAYKKLKKGGKFVVIVPDQEVTFDQVRPITTLEHFIQDNEDPSPDRDYEHYVEFLTLVKKAANPHLMAEEMVEKGLDIHFHTWTLESFYKMAKHSQNEMINYEG